MNTKNERNELDYVTWIILFLIGALTVASVANIIEQSRSFHDSGSAWLVGTGFGVSFSVTVYAVMIARTSRTRYVAIVLALIFGFVSAVIQTTVYQHGGATVDIARAYGFGVPGFEAALAILHALLSDDKRRSEHALNAERAEIERLNDAVNNERERFRQQRREHDEYVQTTKNEHAEQLKTEQDERTRLAGELATLREQYARLAESMNSGERVQPTVKRTLKPAKKDAPAKVDPVRVQHYFANDPHATVRQAADDLGYSIGSINRYKPAISPNGHTSGGAS